MGRDEFYHLTDFEIWTDDNNVVDVGDVCTLEPHEVADYYRYRYGDQCFGKESAICMSPTIRECFEALAWERMPWKVYVFTLDDPLAKPIPACYVSDYELTNEHRIFKPAKFKLESIIYNHCSTEGP